MRENKTRTAIICRVIGKEKIGSVKTETDFDDVEENYWASGYIKTASDAGIINGDGNGSFRPEDDVKYEEAIKMLVCALGLADSVTANPSDWSKPYIDIAKANGITASLKGSKGTASTRADVAVMTYNGICATIAAPVASVAAGSYTSTQSVTLTSATSGAVIYYTTDGSEPTTSSTKYIKAISISKTTTLKAVAVLDDVFAGDVTSVAYTVTVSSGGGGSSSTRYTVTFDLNYGESEEATEAASEEATGETEKVTAPAPQTVKKNNTATEPDEPERDGYIFTGWYTEAECTTLYDFSAKVTKSFTLYAGWSDGSDNSFVVSFDLNYDGATDTPESQTVEKNGYVTVPDEPEREGYVFVGWYTDDSYTGIFDFSTVVTSAIVLYARWVDVTDTTDTDGDGLTDAIEEYLGTDATLYDTDGDGLSDYIEVEVLNLNPLNLDTDDNGINDGDEDADLDGLSNLEEVDLETSLVSSDTDGDGLDDYSEIYTYETDPTLYDTDGDGVSDGKEIELATDPLTAEASFDLNVSSDEDDSVSVSVQIELSGEQVETLSIDKVDNEFLFPEEMPGYIGGAYDFNVDGEFDSAIISFEFDDSLLNDSDFDPVIYYYDEEEGLLEALATTVEGNVASAEVIHFSTYILVNRAIFEESFSWQDVWETDVTYTSLEIVLVIDDSGSMGSQGANNDPDNLRLSVSQDLISDLPDGSAIGIVKFGENINMLTENFIYDKDEAISYLSTDYFHSNEYYTYMYEAIEASFDLFESDADDTLKIMVVLTDGRYNGSNMYSSVVATANENSVKIYTVGLGASNTSYFNSNLKPLSDATGGAFYLAEDATGLDAIYENIGDRIDIETDSDNDGIPDYYEDNMVLFNGITIELDKNNPDTDGDGLLDGEEVVLVYTYNEDRTQVKVSGKVYSNPSKQDSDGDGALDNADAYPLVWDVCDRDLALCAALCYEDGSAAQNEGRFYKLSEIVGDNDEQGESYYFYGMASSTEMAEYWKIVDFVNEWTQAAQLDKFSATTYKNGNNIIIAYRGTNDGLWEWADNILCYGLINYHAEESLARNYAAKIARKYPNCNVYITGHSLGGYLAQIGTAEILKNYSRLNLVETAYFNGIGMKYNKILFWTKDDEMILLENFYESSGNLISYHINGDWVSMLGTHCGKEIGFDASNIAIAHHIYDYSQEYEELGFWQSVGKITLDAGVTALGSGIATVAASPSVIWYYAYYGAPSFITYTWITHETDSFFQYLEHPKVIYGDGGGFR